jgi:hypothetical protein
MTCRAARSRDEYEGNSLSRLKPWEAQGVSRRTWERRRNPLVASPARVASPQLPVQTLLPSQKAFIPPAAPELTPTQFAAARAGVEALLAGMSAENERRRDWFTQPVEGWREKRLTIRSVDGETAIIQLARQNSRK